MLNMNRTQWDALITGVGGTGQQRLRRKEQMVVDYYKSEFDIDMYVLQDSVFRATERIINQ